MADLGYRQLNAAAHEVWYVADTGEGTCKDAPSLLRAVAQMLDDLDSGADDVDLTTLTLENQVEYEGWAATVVVYRRRGDAKPKVSLLASEMGNHG